MPRKGFLAVLGVLGLALLLHGLGAWIHARPLDIAALKRAMPRWSIPPGMDRYDMKIRHVFAEAYGPGVELRQIATGGMLEIATFIRRDELITLQTHAGHSVWDHEHFELILDGEIQQWGSDGRPVPTEEVIQQYIGRTPLNLGQCSVVRRSKRISPELKNRLVAVWKDALEHARQEQFSIGCDGGTSTYFLRTDNARGLAGSTWSPQSGPARALGVVCYLASASILSDGKYGTELDQAITAYWETARQRTAASVELDHHPADLGLHPPQSYEPR